MLAQALPLSRRWRGQALALQGLLLLLFQQPLSIWGSVVCGLLLCWSGWRLWWQAPPLSHKAINLLLAPMLLLLFWQLRSLGVLNFMFHILILSAIARSLSIQLRRDAVQMVWVQYFALTCSFIFYQQMFLAFFIFATLLFNGLLHYQLFTVQQPRFQLKAILRNVGLAMPIWLCLFLFFPRLPPLWQMPNPTQAITGLGNELDPGSIEQLVQSDALAFRVSFEPTPPPREQWYWRAKVYEDFDGRRWQVNQRFQANRFVSSTTAPAQAERLAYNVLAEASFQQALFSLGQPQSWSERAQLAPAALLRSNAPLAQRISYRVESTLQPISLQDQTELELNLQFPSSNPRTLQFAAALKQQHLGQPQAMVDALKTHFRQQQFFYSLTPPRLSGNVVDQFMFETRTGFCSHYASASALILRAAGIPARVVGGYQGGDWQASQQYLIVRQREAHAWVEYLDQGLWHSFDPTAAIAPERILSGIEQALPQTERDLLLGWQPGWIQQLVLQWSHLDYFWSVWVLGFNQQQQTQLWQRLKQWLGHVKTLAVLALLATILVLIKWGFTLWQQQRLAKQSNRFWREQLLKHLPAIPSESMAISTWLILLAKANPEQGPLLEELGRLYEATVFAEEQATINTLLQCLRQHHRQLQQLTKPV